MEREREERENEREREKCSQKQVLGMMGMFSSVRYCGKGIQMVSLGQTIKVF